HLSADSLYRHAHWRVRRFVLRLPALDRPRAVGDSRAAWQTQNGTDGSGGLVGGSGHPTLTILPLPRSAASRRPAPGLAQHQGRPHSSTPPVSAPGLPFSGPFHTHRPAPIEAYLCHGNAPRRGQFSRVDEVTRPHFPGDDDALSQGSVDGSPAGIPTSSFQTSASRSTAENLYRPRSNWARRGHPFLAGRSTCPGDVPAGVADRSCPPLPRPALQSPHQDQHRSAQTRHPLSLSRDWPVMAVFRPSEEDRGSKHPRTPFRDNFQVAGGVGWTASLPDEEAVK